MDFITVFQQLFDMLGLNFDKVVAVFEKIFSLFA